MNKQGFVMELIAFMVVGIISVLFFAAWMYGFGQINTVITNPALDTSSANISNAANQTFGYVNTGLGGLRLIAAVIMVGYILGTFIFAYMSAKNRIWLFVYIMITVLLVIFSMYISNVYNDTLKVNSTLADTIAGFGMTNFVLSNLPEFVAVIGIFGIVFSLIGSVAYRKLEETG